MNILIQASSLVGHELEYIHHFYEYAISDSNNNYIFLIPDNFEDFKGRYEWPSSPNVTFDFVGGKTFDGISSLKGRFGPIRMMINRCLLLRKKCKEHKVDRVLVNFFLDYFPLSLIAIPKGVDFRGIVYKSPYQRKFTKTRKLVTDFVYWTIAKCPAFKKVFLLNDKQGAKYLNEKYNCLKFTCLPDPVPPISTEVRDIREEYDIPANNKVFLQFGGLGPRKRTFDILRAVKNIKDASHLTFIFAGRLRNYKEEFDRLANEIHNGAQVISVDKFIEDELLHSFCYSCDFILVPYRNCDQSSGCLGHAAYFNKPVIGPTDGLLGRLIRDYQIGVCLPSDMTIDDISNILESADQISSINGKEYIDFCSVANFQKTMIE